MRTVKPKQDDELRLEYERSDFGAMVRGKYADRSDSSLEAWNQVYEGFSDGEIAEVESMALGRSRFSRDKP